MRRCPKNLLTAEEKRLLARLNSPAKIQDWLNSIPINFETRGGTCLSPRRVIKEKQAHCLEGALLAALALWYHGQQPLLLDLKITGRDQDHVVTLFKRQEAWGAISKTNHAVLRYREPIYKTVRELALSYFHEYFLNSGRKTLRQYSEPFDLSKLAPEKWITREDNLWDISDILDESPHFKFLTTAQEKNLRRAEPIEIQAGKIVEWKLVNKKPRRMV